MIEFLSQYTMTEIIIFLLLFVIAVKNIWDTVDYFIAKYNNKFNKDYNIKKQQENLSKHYEDCKDQHVEAMKLYNLLDVKLNQLSSKIDSKFKDLDNRLDDLTTSDMYDIKQAIVKDYHYFVEQQKWIDDFSLDVLERRFGVYSSRGGNTYVAGLMSELRQLPKHPLI